MRYFIVFYMGVGKVTNRDIYGMLEYGATHYPNLKEITSSLKDTGLVAITLTNIIELSKEDFDEFKR